MEKQSNTIGDIWTAKRLAKVVGLDPSRIRQLLIEGVEVKGYKIGPVWAIPEHEAHRFISNRRHDT